MSEARVVTQVALEINDAVATIRFETETGVNVFSSPTMGALGNAVFKIAEDPAVRIVVFRGVGKTFVAGADIKEMTNFREEDGKAFSQHGHDVFSAIENLPQVTIAALNGHAMGGGCELAMACDFRLMVNGAKIGQPESRLGLIPGWGGTIRLPKLVGPNHARKLMFGGEAIGAEEALRIGLVDEVIPSIEEIDQTLDRWRRLMLMGCPAAIKRIKLALRDGDEIHHFADCFDTEACHGGMEAFIDKRPAPWMPVD